MGLCISSSVRLQKAGIQPYYFGIVIYYSGIVPYIDPLTMRITSNTPPLNSITHLPTFAAVTSFTELPRCPPESLHAASRARRRC